MTTTPNPKALFTRKWMLANHKSPSPFHSAKFDTVFSNQSILKHIEDLKSAIDIEMYISSRLLPEDFFIDLEIYSHKHPHIPVNLSRVVLPHPCHNEDTSVLVLVKDSKIDGRKLKPELTIKQYETLFRNKKIDQKVITFMTLSQLFNDYAGYEERRKLSFMYEQFIVDNSIAVKVNSFLGTKLLNEGRAAFPTDLSDQDELADNIDEALRTVYYMYNPPTDDQGSKTVIHVGRQSMANEQIVENIVDLLHQLQDLHPGGCNNVGRLIIRANAQVEKGFQLYIDNSAPLYPEQATDTTEDSKPDPEEQLVQKVFVHISIIPCESVVMDKDEEMFDDTRRDVNPPGSQFTNKQDTTAQPNVNLEQQVVNALKHFVAKSKGNTSSVGVTSNRVIRRRRAQVAASRNDRMF